MIINIFHLNIFVGIILRIGWLCFVFIVHRQREKGDVLREVSDNVVGALISGFLRKRVLGAHPNSTHENFAAKWVRLLPPKVRGWVHFPHPL